MKMLVVLGMLVLGKRKEREDDKDKSDRKTRDKNNPTQKEQIKTVNQDRYED